MSWIIAIVAGVPVFVYILNGGLYLRDKALIPLIPLFCYMLAMYIKKVSCEEFSWGGCIPYVVTMELIYIGRRNGKSVAIFDDRISDYVWLLSGNRCDKRSVEKTKEDNLEN